MSDLDPATTTASQSPIREAWGYFISNRAALLGLIILGIILFGAVFGPWLYPTDPFEMVWAPFSPPGEQGYLLGTDYLGRDLTAMMINGAVIDWPGATRHLRFHPAGGCA